MLLDNYLRRLRPALQDGPIGPKEAAACLSVSDRQSRRIMGGLAEAGLLRVRQAGRRKFYSLAPLALEVSPATPLTEAEARALYLAGRFAQAAFDPTPLGAPLRQALGKVAPADGTLVAFDPAAGRFAATAPTGADVETAVFESAWRAAEEGLRLRLTYTNAAGQRSDVQEVEPYGLVLAGGAWHLLAHSPYHGRVVRYALSDVEAAEPGDPFDRAPLFDLDGHAREAWRAFDGDEVAVVRLAVSPGAAAAFRRRRYHPTQCVEGTDREGGLVVSFEVAPTVEVEAFVRSFGSAVQVLAPETLARRVAASLREAAARYEAPRPTG